VKVNSKGKPPKVPLGPKPDSPIEVGQERHIDLSININDTGCGISKEGISNLFMNFGKLKENAHKNKQGTGLGLSISKRLIE